MERALGSIAAAGVATIWRAAPDGAFLEHQSVWEKFTGQPWEQHRGLGWLGAVEEDARSRILAALAAHERPREIPLRFGLWSAAHGAHVPVMARWLATQGQGGYDGWLGIATRTLDGPEPHGRIVGDPAAEPYQLFSLASHDLKEPIRGIHHYARFIIEDEGDALSDSGRKRIESIIGLSRRMDALVESVLAYCALSLRPPVMAQVHLDSAVRDAVRPFTERGAEVTIPEPLPIINCDAGLAAEVFRRLVSNACKFNERQAKRVRIGWEKPAEGRGPAVFCVEDNGIGIREKHLPLLFRMFKRLNARDEFDGGSGMGLAIADKIVRLHGGRIWARSRFGEGSTFSFTLQGENDDGEPSSDHAG